MGTLVVLTCFSYGACTLEARKIYLATNETLTSYILYPGLHLGVGGRGRHLPPCQNLASPWNLQVKSALTNVVAKYKAQQLSHCVRCGSKTSDAHPPNVLTFHPLSTIFLNEPLYTYTCTVSFFRFSEKLLIFDV